jgi:ABC-2 type transport system ATP-binding protein
VRRLASDGVTVFLTTQYLEEADVLADRVGIIDRGRIVAEGTPSALKAEVGRPTVEAASVEPGDRERLAGVLQRFGDEAPASPGAVAVRLRTGVSDLADVVRALDSETIAIADLRLHAPSLDDVFLAKTGRSLEGAGADGDAGKDKGNEAAAADAVSA